MLPKENRLKREKDFERVFKKGKRFKGRFLFLRVLKSDLSESRFGFIVSKKISKKAVVRNKIKRRLREIIRSKLLDVKGGFDILIISLSGIENKEFKEVEEEVDEILKRTGIINRIS